MSKSINGNIMSSCGPEDRVTKNAFCWGTLGEKTQTATRATEQSQQCILVREGAALLLGTVFLPLSPPLSLARWPGRRNLGQGTLAQTSQRSSTPICLQAPHPSGTFFGHT